MNRITVTDRLITKITGYIAVIIVIALIIWGCITIRTYYKYEMTDDAQVQEYINPVIARSGGFVVAVKFEENQDVKKGDTLFLIDNREYKLQVAQAKASLEKATAQLNVLESNVHTLEKAAGALNAQISAGKARVLKQQLDYNRYNKMYEEESATKQQLENMKATLDVNNADYLAAIDNYEAAKSKIEDAEAEKSVVRAEITRLEALKQRDDLDVSYTVVTASYNGRMGKRTIETGQMIDPGQVLGFIVDNETCKWIVGNFKETQIANMKIGDTAKIILDAFPAHPYKGTIVSFSPATGSSFSLLPPDNSTGNYVKIVQRIPVRIRVDGPGAAIDKLKAGMNATVYMPKN